MLRPPIISHGRSHSLPEVGAIMDFDSYTLTLCSADTKRNIVAYLLEARWGNVLANEASRCALNYLIRTDAATLAISR